MLYGAFTANSQPPIPLILTDSVHYLNQAIVVKMCKPASDADTAVIETIRQATRDIWHSRHIAECDVEITIWAKNMFADLESFTNFVLNWANVETGGHFNADHVNWSKNESECNVGVLQMNQKWSTRHDTWGWHDSNPHNFSAEDAKDPYKCVFWALHHLIGFGIQADWNLTKMLDSYWHGTFNDPSPYADGVYHGKIIYYPE